LIPLPDGAPPGPYAVRVGLYLLATGDRLTLPDGGSEIILPGDE